MESIGPFNRAVSAIGFRLRIRSMSKLLHHGALVVFGLALFFLPFAAGMSYMAGGASWWLLAVPAWLVAGVGFSAAASH